MRTCRFCAQEFLPSSNNQQTCSPECRRKHRNALGTARYRVDPTYYREKGAMQASSRRRLDRSLDEKFTRRDVWEKDGPICLYCEAELEWTSWEMDHFTPLARGGKHSLANCVVSCRPCNRKKHSKTIEEFVFND